MSRSSTWLAAGVATKIMLATVLVTSPTVAQDLSPDIRLNQIGFYPGEEKVAAVVGAAAGTFTVATRDLSETVFTGDLSVARMWSPAQESIRLADFSALTDEGEYVLIVGDLGRSHPFTIADNVHQAVATASIKAYYYQRASTRLEPAFADIWARPAGHLDDQVKVHASAASADRPTGTIIAAPRGWYDAGDYNKYLVNSGISTGQLLMLYEHFPNYFAELETRVPESGNGVPDLLDEILWNMRWMLAMQDPAAGGVYTKLTTANFEGMVMPDKARSQRYVVMKSTAATLDFVALSALTSRLIRPFGDIYPGLADSLDSAAHQAWNWARLNPQVVYDQNAMNGQFEPDINTGGYGDNNFSDEFRWAASEMFITTGQDSFMVLYPPGDAPNLSDPRWQYVDPLAFASLAFHRENISAVVDTAAIRKALIDLANRYVNLKDQSPLGTTMGVSSGDFFWGSNSYAANQGFILIQAYGLTGDRRYLEAAISNMDYLLGRNGTGYSFVTGHGDRTPMHPHHRQSASDGVQPPVPGLVAGGPNPGQQDGCDYPSTLPAKSYVDDWCSYASNEIAINWNAAFAYLSGAVEAILAPTGQPVSLDAERQALPDRGALGQFNFGPNPATGMIRLEFTLDGPDEVEISIFDMLGRAVARPVSRRAFASGSHQQVVDMGQFPAGLYAITLEDSGRRLTRIAALIR